MQVGVIPETPHYASDTRQAADFYRRLFGFPILLESERLIALVAAGKRVLLLFPEGGTSDPFPVPGGGGVIPPRRFAPRITFRLRDRGRIC